jgi:hypothetical protein
MRNFSSRTNLYRSVAALVILAAFVFAAWRAVSGQVSKGKVSKGPRAVGLVELLPKGKARLIPIVILVDGQYYDAGAYKASPVPMALWAETEYEAFRTGVSQGLFIVTEALQNQKTSEWLGEGSWQTSEELAAKSAKKPRASIPRGLEDDSGPPVLRHSGASKPKPPEAAPSPPATQSTTQAQSAAPVPTAQSGTSSAQSQTPAGQTSSPNPSSAPSTASQTASASKPSTSTENPEQADENDPNRPVLKRGKSVPAPIEESVPSANAAAHAPGTAPKLPAHPAATFASTKSQPQLLPAISDADGPEAHTYQYDIKAADETVLRNKILALSADEVRARAKQLSSELIAPARSARAGKPGAREKPAQPNFEDVQFRIFDLSSSNEPTMVLTASARMPARATESALVDLQYFVTLVARQDINGDIHKAFANVTDQRHLDVEPKFELIDAVDVDGDGRAELLFRKEYDEGTAYVVYRVIGDQLYPLFEGTPGE